MITPWRAKRWGGVLSAQLKKYMEKSPQKASGVL